jgi:serine/threonine-protein kinase
MASNAAAADPLSGTTLGGWRIEQQLGGHKNCRVYKARHERLNRRAAIKVLDSRLAKDEEAVSRFFCEARAVAELGAEHLVDVFDFIYDPKNGRVAYAMELLRGRDLRHLLENCKLLAPTRAARIAAQLCEALAAIHKVGVVHRDLNPSNIVLVRRGGDADYVKLLDFGTARFPGRVRHETAAGTQVGTPAYIAPEQASSPDVDARADLYSVGCILHQMLTGKTPYAGATGDDVITNKLLARVAPLPLGDHGAGLVSPALAAIVQRLLARDPKDRFPDAQSARTALLGSTGMGDPWLADDRTIAVQPLAPKSSTIAARVRSVGLGVAFAAGLASGLVLAFIR